MEKNKKTRHIVSNVQYEDNSHQKAPLEFLTSDNFQVVSQKRKNPRKCSNNPEGPPSLYRSHSDSSTLPSDCVLEDTDDHGYHSSFWNVHTSENLSHLVTAENYIPEVPPGRSIDNGSYISLPEHNDESCYSSMCESGISSSEIDSPDCDGIGYMSDAILVNTSHSASLSKCDPKPFHSETEDNFLAFEGNHNSAEITVSEIIVEDNVKNERNNYVLNIEKDLKTVNCNKINGCDKDIFIHDSKLLISNDKKKNCGRKELESKGENKKDKYTSRKIKPNAKNNWNINSSDELISIENISRGEAAPNNLDKNEEVGRKLTKDAENKNRKRPSKSQLAAIHEALRKAKETEEKHKKEEETRLKIAEEAERQRQEKQRQEQEKKDRKKLREKEKKVQLKAEGRLLSKSQKQARARLQATLDVYRQQGIQVPEINNRNRAASTGNCKAVYRMRVNSSQSDNAVKEKSERLKSESLSSQDSKESFSDIPNSFDSKESWDMSSHIDSVVTTESEIEHFSFSDASDTDEGIDAGSLPKNKFINQDEKTTLAERNVEISTALRESKPEKLRSPVVCVLGHVDTGKTKILDYIRKTNVQNGEAGGITQQIGATMIPHEALKEKCKMVKEFVDFKIKVPGLLVIDTPGHESFNNLRIRGTSICDISILVVDVMHGLEAQTIESINILKRNKIPFIIALNKVDRIYGWKSDKEKDVESVINSQNHATFMEFKERCNKIILELANQCLNAVLFYENKDPRTYISMVPTSAITGDGMGNILSLITELTQSLMYKKLIFSEQLEATVLEVKAIPGLGTTIDIILVNGRLQEGDTIILAGQDGPIVTQIRSLLMPHSLKELRVKNSYIEYKIIEGAQGVKVTGKDMDKTIAGMPIFVVKNHSDIETLKLEISNMCKSINYIKTSERGVFVQASTLGSLEALLEYLGTSDIPYFGVKIGPVVKKDVMKASIMLEHDAQYAAILAFDVKVEKDAQDLADHLGVKIFSANIIYHLYDQFVQFRESILKKREEVKHLAVFPCLLSIVDDTVTVSENSMTICVKVVAGLLRINTPLCVPSKGNIDVGVVSIIQSSDKITSAKEGQVVNICLDQRDVLTPKVYGTDFDGEDYLASRLSRQSIEVCKEHYMDDVDWDLISELKKMQHV